MQERGAGTRPLNPDGDRPSDAPAAGAGRARWPLLFGVAAVVLAADQLTKWWAVEVLGDGTIDLIGSLRLKRVVNHGSAFSLAEGRGALISLLALAIVAVLLRSGRYATRPLSALSIGLVVGGAVGNLIDRAVREGHGFLGGGVVDFIDLQWWPVFNVADSAIVVGALLLFVAELREEDAPRRDRRAGAPDAPAATAPPTGDRPSGETRSA